MTLNAAWIGGDSAFLVSDTAVTRAGTASSPLTSLGQPQARSDGRVVEEAAAKIVQLGSHAAAAMCGDAAGAIACVRDSLRRLSAGAPLADALLAAGNSLHHQEPAFAPFVVTVVHWDEQPRILQYCSNTFQLKHLDTNQVVIEGSLRVALKEELRARIIGLPGRAIRIPPELVLGASLGFLQSFAANEDLITDFVGGVLYGLRVDAAGLHWQPNMLYLFYQNDGPALGVPPMQIVSCQILDDVCVVGSSLNKEIRCLVHAGRDPGRLAWQKRWKAAIKMRESIQNSRLIALIRIGGGSVVIIPNDHKHVVPRYEPTFELGLSSTLTARLLWKPSAETPRNFSLGLVDPEVES